MKTIQLLNQQQLSQPVAIALARHRVLRESHPCLPRRSASDFAARLGWMLEHGRVLALCEGEDVLAYWASFRIDNFRNLGPGEYCPDWANGARVDLDVTTRIRCYRLLYREMAARAVSQGTPVHAISVYAHDEAAMEALSLSGFGRIVTDRVRTMADLQNMLSAATRQKSAVTIRLASGNDSAALCQFNGQLAQHLGASPVFLPAPRAWGAQEWRDWLQEDGNVALVAVQQGEICGYIKAEGSQFDVSYSLEDPANLSISGLFVAPELRGQQIARQLLAALVDYGLQQGRSFMAVDCETTNLEALGFWSRFFEPVNWSYERRI